MSKGGISPSGRFLRFWLWRLPVGVTRYSVARNMAVVTEEGRRWLALASFGFWVALLWYAADFLEVLVLQQWAGFFGLLLIWRVVANLRRLWAHRRNLQSMARNAQIQRDIAQTVAALPGQINQLARQAIPGGAFTVPGMHTHHDPVRDEAERIAREQAEEMRDPRWLGPDAIDLPIGDRFEPIWRLPRFMRRKLKDEEGP